MKTKAVSLIVLRRALFLNLVTSKYNELILIQVYLDAVLAQTYC